MKLDNNNHSVFCLYYHLVLVVKYRRNVFTSEISTYAKEIFIRISTSYNIFLEEKIIKLLGRKCFGQEVFAY